LYDFVSWILMNIDHVVSIFIILCLNISIYHSLSIIIYLCHSFSSYIKNFQLPHLPSQSSLSLGNGFSAFFSHAFAAIFLTVFQCFSKFCFVGQAATHFPPKKHNPKISSIPKSQIQNFKSACEDM